MLAKPDFWIMTLACLCAALAAHTLERFQKRNVVDGVAYRTGPTNIVEASIDLGATLGNQR